MTAPSTDRAIKFTDQSTCHPRTQAVVEFEPSAVVGGRNATRMFDAAYSVPLAHGRLADWIAPGATNIYCVGAGKLSVPPRS